MWKVSAADGNVSPEERGLTLLVEMSYCLLLLGLVSSYSGLGHSG